MVETGFIDKLKNAKDTLFGGGTLTKEPDNEPKADLTTSDSPVIEDITPREKDAPVKIPYIPPQTLSDEALDKFKDIEDITEEDLSSKKSKKRRGSKVLLPSDSKDTNYPDTSEIPPMATPEIPKTETPSVDIPKTETLEIPKTETPVVPTIEEYPPEAIPPEDKEGVKEGINKILGKFGKRLPTKEETITGVKGLKEGVLSEEPDKKPKEKKKEGVITEEETIPLNAKEREYAILGGYKGSSREQLLSDNKALREYNVRIRSQIDKIDEELEGAIERSNAYKIETAGLKKPSTDTVNSRAAQQRLLNADVEKLEKKKEKLQLTINENNKAIRDNNFKISEYDEAVLKGKKISSPRSQIGKKLQKLGEGADTVSSGVYGGKSFGKGDWFGDKGFLSQPFKQANILRSPLEPVKTSSRGLDNITRSTGGSVGRNLMDVSQVRPNKNIAPMGAPGTIYGARQQFDYNIPARKISLLDASGMTRSNINRDILPNLYDAPKPAQIPMQQYKEIIQEDGSVVQVPVPVQARKSKLFTVSVNRYTKGAKINGMKVGKVNNRLDRGMKSVDTGSMLKNIETFKPVYTSKKSSTQISRGVKSVGNIKLVSNLAIETSGLSQHKTIKPMVIGKRPDVNLGLLSIKNIGITTPYHKGKNTKDVVEIVQAVDRKPKKSEPLAKLGFTLTGIKLNKNLKKLVMEKKSK